MDEKQKEQFLDSEIAEIPGFIREIRVEPRPSSELHVQINQVIALEKLAHGVNVIADFLTQGGLTNYAKAQGLNGVLNGLVTNMGRNGLDARTIKQNAIEITEIVESVFTKMQERVTAKNNPLARMDTEIHNPEDEMPMAGESREAFVDRIKAKRQKQRDEMELNGSSL